MLNGISPQELSNKNIIQESDIEKIQSKNKNPYAAVDKDLLIDESNISSEAIKLYQRDLDIKRFTALAMSDPQDTSHNKLVVEKIFQSNDEQFTAKTIEKILENREFIQDLLR